VYQNLFKTPIFLITFEDTIPENDLSAQTLPIISKVGFL